MPKNQRVSPFKQSHEALNRKPFVFKNNIKKNVFYCSQNWAQLFAIKRARNMPNGRTSIKIHNSFKNKCLLDILVGMFVGELELKGNYFTNASKNCFPL